MIRDWSEESSLSEKDMDHRSRRSEKSGGKTMSGCSGSPAAHNNNNMILTVTARAAVAAHPQSDIEVAIYFCRNVDLIIDFM
jgi:hypothetical protein